MKKPVFIFLICLITGMVSAQKGGRITSSPTLNNTSIRRSEKAENRQLKSFQNTRRYSGVVNSHASKQLRRNRSKAKQSQQDQGKGL